MKESVRENIVNVLDNRKDTENISKQERLMLRNVLKINEITARDIMIPRANISAVEVSNSLDMVLGIFLKEAHSRAPVYEKNLDNIIGMVHIKDLLKHKINNSENEAIFLQNIKREILRIPPSMPVLDLLMKMQLTRIHMAIVIDEYGGSAGLLTIEDVIEEITGEIEDEHDQQNIPMLIRTGQKSFEVSARVQIKDFEKLINLSLAEDDEINTLGGLIFSMIGRVPQRGEIIKHNNGMIFEILDADPRKIKTLKIFTSQ
jgi:CBS domain containing-hemolysin-like protein